MACDSVSVRFSDAEAGGFPPCRRGAITWLFVFTVAIRGEFCVKNYSFILPTGLRWCLAPLRPNLHIVDAVMLALAALMVFSLVRLPRRKDKLRAERPRGFRGWTGKVMLTRPERIYPALRGLGVPASRSGLPDVEGFLYLPARPARLAFSAGRAVRPARTAARRAWLSPR